MIPMADCSLLLNEWTDLLFHKQAASYTTVKLNSSEHLNKTKSFLHFEFVNEIIIIFLNGEVDLLVYWFGSCHRFPNKVER